MILVKLDNSLHWSQVLWETLLFFFLQVLFSGLCHMEDALEPLYHMHFNVTMTIFCVCFVQKNMYQLHLEKKQKLQPSGEVHVNLLMFLHIWWLYVFGGSPITRGSEDSRINNRLYFTLLESQAWKTNNKHGHILENGPLQMLTPCPRCVATATCLY